MIEKEKRLNPRPLEQFVIEINSVFVPKLFNIEHGTATERERQVVAECLGFISLIKFSCLPLKDIKRLWENSGLKFQ